MEDFDREVHGRVLKQNPKVTWEVTGTTPGTNGKIPIITNIKGPALATPGAKPQ